MSGTRTKRERPAAREGFTATRHVEGLPRLPLPPLRSEALELRIRQLVYRWEPKTEEPIYLVRDLYTLIAWVLDDNDPDCPTLQVD